MRPYSVETNAESPEHNSRAALPFGKTALFVMKMKKPNYLAFMAAL